MKKKILLALLSLVCITACAFSLAACDLFDGGSSNGDEGKGQQGVSYGTATVNYHYEYDVVMEHYWQVKYSIVSGEEYEIELDYTPPMKAGYRFLGWTREEGGVGNIVGNTYSVMGSGFGGTVYDFYAKYEIIEFEVVYHLDGGSNHADNPASLTGKQTLKNPTKDKHNFDGWYRDPEFKVYTTTASMTDDVTTTVNLYAKWIRVYEISYVSDQPKVNVKGDQSYWRYSSFTEDTAEFTIDLRPEYFENYMFIGWEIEEGASFVQSAEITINPSETKKDLTYTAHYLAASNPANTEGLRTLISYGKHYFFAREEVKRIVVEDMYGSKANEYTNTVYIYYSGEEPPEVFCREDASLQLIHDPDEVERRFINIFG